jgi:hypothetical protein
LFTTPTVPASCTWGTQTINPKKSTVWHTTRSNLVCMNYLALSRNIITCNYLNAWMNTMEHSHAPPGVDLKLQIPFSNSTKMYVAWSLSIQPFFFLSNKKALGASSAVQVTLDLHAHVWIIVSHPDCSISQKHLFCVVHWQWPRNLSSTSASIFARNVGTHVQNSTIWFWRLLGIRQWAIHKLRCGLGCSKRDTHQLRVINVQRGPPWAGTNWWLTKRILPCQIAGE